MSELTEKLMVERERYVRDIAIRVFREVDEMLVKVVIQSRDLSKDELGGLLQSIRDCEQRLFKDKEIYISAEAPELTSDEMAEILRKIRPPFTYGPVIFKYKEEGESVAGFGK